MLVGYRWFDHQNVEPLYAFGHGLSYTKFAYSDFKVSKGSDGGADISVNIKNTGDVAGDEVPQVYLDAPKDQPTGAQFAVRTLAAFDRVSLRAGESKTVTMHVNPRQFQYWSTTQNAWVTPKGSRELKIGPSSRELPLTATTD